LERTSGRQQQQQQQQQFGNLGSQAPSEVQSGENSTLSYENAAPTGSAILELLTDDKYSFRKQYSLTRK
jgi:hypothetical protein